MNLRELQTEHADSIFDTTRLILDFVSERDWFKFHTPKNLAESLVLEASEVLDLYQWDKEHNPARLAPELADVAIYLFEFANMAGIDLLRAVREKLEVNAEKYPVEKCRGRSEKYDKL